jgi:polysaccharide pyruvyl transferase CsaB
LKILTLISGGDYGGAKTHVFSILRRVNLTDTNDLVCFREGDFASEARALGIPTTVISGGIAGTLRALVSFAKKGGYDVIHSHGSRGNAMAVLLKAVLKLPVVTTIHSDYASDYKGRPLAALTYGNVNRFALSRIDYYIGVSALTAQMLIDRGFTPERVFVMYNGIEMGVEAENADDYTANADVNTANADDDTANADDNTANAGIATAKTVGVDAHIDPAVVTIGIAARLEPIKDIATLIRAFVIAHKSVPFLRLKIAGTGVEEEMLKTLAADLGVADFVEFLGWVSDTDAFYKTLDINALTSLSEGLPYVLVEGAKYKLATVSTKVGGVGELINSGVNGCLVPVGDINALAEAFIRYATDEPFRRLHGGRLYELVKEKFSLTAMVNTQLDIYTRIISSHRRSKAERFGVTLCGAYGMGNIGDEGILKAIISEIRAIDRDIPIYVLSRKPKLTRRVHRVRAVHTFNVLRFPFLARGSKLYINGGGSLIQDETSSRSLWFYLYTILAAKLSGTKVLMYGCGIGPVSKPFNRRLAGKIIDGCVSAITLRDGGNESVLRSLGVVKPEVYIAADPALTLGNGETSSGAEDSREYAVTLRDWHGIDGRLNAIAAAIDGAYDRHGLTPVFIPIDAKDLPVMRKTSGLLKCPYRVHGVFNTPEELIDEMRTLRFALSMRLHALIFAASAEIPLGGIVYDPKVQGFLEHLGQRNYVALEDLTAEKLSEIIETCLMNRENPGTIRLRELEAVNREVLGRHLAMFS